MRELLDPFLPVPVGAGKSTALPGHARHAQRARRSEILATIRRLLTEGGCEAVTVRGIAEASGCAVQTIYNLVGPRDHAISEAISEYSIFVGRMASPALESPAAIAAIARMWVDVSKIREEFARQCNLIIFTDSRGIYYRFRDRQLRGMLTLLRRQQQGGILRRDTDIVALGEQLVFYSCAMWVDWADRPFPLDLLQRKLQAAFANILSDIFTADHAAAALAAFAPPEH